ncbi:hypothetical protein COMNV_00953 [Commensalibacter sp. Nvir]|uniref:OmpA family protein n=1 Tax=Commensalibacter sp. Nvir TaxID=3069817 RepID=UPI002D507F6E|nr:hypothetical protein COMNV_00953 [Commensalibacter sp. Nvir]
MLLIHRPFHYFFLVLGLLSLEGCADSPLIKTPVGWYHNLEGGIVAQPRLPIIGSDQPYPHVGLTPTQAPPLPSPDLRKEITNNLQRDRTLSEWQNTVDSFSIPKPTTPNKGTLDDHQTKNKPSEVPNSHPTAVSKDTKKQNLNDSNQKTSQESSATLDAAGDEHPSLANKKTPETKKNQIAQKDQNTAVNTPVVIPELRMNINNQPITLPAIPVNPPLPPQFPQFNIPSNQNLPPPFYPSGLETNSLSGDLISFPPDSDTPNINQEKIISDIATKNKGKRFYIHGYGDSLSIDANSQAQALTLALLRAKTIAKLLINHNVPESSIFIRLHAIGHGVRVKTEP